MFAYSPCSGQNMVWYPAIVAGYNTAISDLEKERMIVCGNNTDQGTGIVFYPLAVSLCPGDDCLPGRGDPGFDLIIRDGGNMLSLPDRRKDLEVQCFACDLRPAPSVGRASRPIGGKTDKKIPVREPDCPVRQ